MEDRKNNLKKRIISVGVMVSMLTANAAPVFAAFENTAKNETTNNNTQANQVSTVTADEKSAKIADFQNVTEKSGGYSRIHSRFAVV